jgi:UDP-glucose 4-epimerase
MRVLVTGATGFIGRHLCRSLLEDNVQVVALFHRNTCENLAFIGQQSSPQCVQGDLRDSAALQEILEQNDVEAVLHLAAHIPRGHSAQDPFLSFEVNCRGTLNLLQACQLASVRRFVYASTLSVYNFRYPAYLPVDELHPEAPVDLYGASKLVAETYCRFYAQRRGIRTVVLRLSGVYGPGREGGVITNFTRSALLGEPFHLSASPSQTKDFIYVQDAVSAFVLALYATERLDFDLVNIGSGEEVSIQQVLEWILNFTGSNVHISFASNSPGSRFVFDIAKARHLLGFAPVPMRQRVKEYVALTAKRLAH